MWREKCEGAVQNVMRLDNPALVPQHEQPGLLFWSASLVGNNECGVQWRHTGNHPPFWLRIGHAESECVDVFVLCMVVVVVVGGGRVCSFPPVILSTPLAISPRTKGQRSCTLFANGCSALFKNPFTISWRLTQLPSGEPTRQPLKAPSFTKP